MLKRLFGKTLTTAAYVIQYGCIAHCILEFVGDFVVCSGISMEPTVFSGDIVLTEHISATVHHINRGDIIISRSPVKPRQFICKRVIGLPGDSVHHPVRFVPRGHLWLEGDNKENSLDSRSYGPVPQALVRGRVVYKIWPPRTATMLTDRWLP